MTATEQRNINTATPSVVVKILGLSSTGKLIVQDLSLTPMSKALVGLGDVDNTSDLQKPISTQYQNALDLKVDKSTYNANDILTKLKTVDGAGSGLDAELLNGQAASYYTNIPARLGYTPVNPSIIGQNNGIAPLDSSGKVPAANLPSYVDDVLEFANFASFPVSGESGKIYVDASANTCYRWSGTTYILIQTVDLATIQDDVIALALVLG